MRYLFVLTSVLLGVWPLSGDDPLESTFPQEAEGNIRFQADVVMFYEDGRPAPEVSLAIPRSALEERSDDSLQVKVAVEMLDRGGNPRARYETELALGPDSTQSDSRFPVPERWLRLHPRWLPETAGLRVEVEDVTRIKAGIISVLQGNHPKGVVEGRVRAPIEGEPTPLLSDVLFAWSLAEGSDSAGPGLRSVRSRIKPNPFRYYGLFQPVISTYLERYGLPEGMGEGEDAEMHYEIRRAGDGALALETTDEITVSERPQWELKRFDVSGLPAGSYELAASLRTATGETLERRQGTFQVLWEERRWTEDQELLMSYSRILFNVEENDSFMVMSRGEREEFLREFWNRRQPVPRGQINPLETKFLERIEKANELFKGYRPGFETDRGLVYVRLGEPDEISFNLIPQDKELLGFVLEEEEDPSDIETGRATSRLRSTKLWTVRDNRAYEVWEYTMYGDPLIPEYTGMKNGLKFIFVDELGYGDYSLVYTNLPGGMR